MRCVFIHSHRRSGTHLLLDTISSWFETEPGYTHFPLSGSMSAAISAEHNSDFRRISLIKTHEPYYGFQSCVRHLWTSPEAHQREIDLYKRSKHIYVLRNPFFVLRSLYIFDVMGGESKFKISPNTTMHDYTFGRSLHEANEDGYNRLEYWGRHILRWAEEDAVLVLDYNELLTERTSALERISKHIELPIRSSPNAVEATAIGRHLTGQFLKQGREAVWDSIMIEAVEAEIRSIRQQQPRLRSYVNSWMGNKP